MVRLKGSDRPTARSRPSPVGLGEHERVRVADRPGDPDDDRVDPFLVPDLDPVAAVAEVAAVGVLGDDAFDTDGGEVRVEPGEGCLPVRGGGGECDGSSRGCESLFEEFAP
nr:hypothetical protein [Saccharothrix variisporea]